MNKMPTPEDCAKFAEMHRQRSTELLAEKSATMADWARRQDMADEHEKWAEEFDALANEK